MALKQETRIKILAALAAICAISWLIYSAIIGPGLTQRADMLATESNLLTELQKMQRDVLLRDQIESLYATVEPLLGKGGTDQEEISSFTREISQVYDDSRVRIRSVKILPVANEQFYRRIGVKIEMAGPVTEVLKFVGAIEANQKPMSIEQMTVKADETAGKVNASFIVSKVVRQAGRGAA